jgi:predicted transcriptional regulator of viral defense system
MSLIMNRSKVKDIASKSGGYLRMIDAIDKGVSRRSFYKMRDLGELIQESRGLYRHQNWELNSEPDLTHVSMLVPKAVISLISALSFHEITTQIPHCIHISLPEGHAPPHLDWPPIECHHISGKAYSCGIETHTIGGIDVNIYSIEKTIADCFKFRFKIGGLDVCLEALKLAREEQKLDFPKLFEYARICRVFNVILPYTQAIR